MKNQAAMTQTDKELSETLNGLLPLNKQRKGFWGTAALLLRKGRRKEKEPSQPVPGEQKLYLQNDICSLAISVGTRSISCIDLKQFVQLPEDLDYNEWLATHTIALFDHINLLYGTISEFCTMSGCPVMSGPCNTQYPWFDDKGKKCKCAAPQYIDYVMTFIQKTINDESIFPTKYGNVFPSSFESIVKKIQRLLFHVIAHIYHSHFREIICLNVHLHLNCVFAHMTLFNQQFNIIEDKETEILQDLVDVLKLNPNDSNESTVATENAEASSSGSAAVSNGTEAVSAVAVK